MKQPYASNRQDQEGSPPDERAPTPGNPVLSAKLTIPPPPRVNVVRHGLLDKLTAASHAQLTAITGPAGSGKTKLISQWARAGMARGPVVWLTLDDDDNSPEVFWSYVLHALRRSVPRIDLDSQAPTQANASYRSVLARLATSLSVQPTPVVLVLDRAESVTNQDIAADLDLLLRWTPALRLIVVGRGAGLIPLHRYRLAGELAEIDKDDLALTLEETAEILQAYAVRCTDDEVVSLFRTTEGWMTAVCLHALALHAGRNGPTAFPHPAGHQAVAEFLRTEVLAVQPPRVRDMLLRTSIVKKIHPDLADRLTGRHDARGALDELVRANTFVVPLDDSQFRYQKQFRDMLNDELTVRHPDLVRRLHSQAARWCTERGLLPEALHHAIRIGDWDLASNVAINSLGTAWLLTASDAESCRSVLADLPHDRPGPAAELLRAILALAQYDTATATSAVNRAAASVDELDGRRIALRLGISTIQVVLSRLSGDLEAIEAAAATMDTLWPRLAPGELADEARTRSLVLSNLGATQLWAGRLQEARATLGRAAASTDPGTEYSVHDALAHLAMLQLYEGELHQADNSARESLAVADRAGLRPDQRVGAACAALAVIALLWDDLPTVREHMSQVIVAVSSRHDPPTATAVALLRAHLASGRLDGRRALAAVETARANAAGWHISVPVADQIELTAIAVHLVLGDTVEARHCLDRMSDTAERTLAFGHILTAEGDRKHARGVLSTIAAHNAQPVTLQYAALALGRLSILDGDSATAVRAMREALEYGRPEQRRRPFAEAGAWVRQLLRQHPELGDEHSWLKSQTDTRQAGTGVVAVLEPLTEREVEVLSQLCQALSMDDIADALYLSVNTVKTHLKSIYRKLGTSGRSAAARRARELDLLPATEPEGSP
jgi:LuxR family maltose regulon positive regulatory protein